MSVLESMKEMKFTMQDMCDFQTWLRRNYWQYMAYDEHYHNMVDNTLDPRTLPELLSLFIHSQIKP